MLAVKRDAPNPFELHDLVAWLKLHSSHRAVVADYADPECAAMPHLAVLTMARSRERGDEARMARKSLFLYLWRMGWQLERIAIVFERTGATINAIVRGRKR